MRNFLLTLCACVLSFSAFAQLSGQVLDSVTLQPVFGAVVQVPDRSSPPVTADAEGRFGFNAVFDVPVTLRVTHLGYAAKDISVFEDLQNVRILLRPVTHQLDEVIVSATRAGDKTPTTYQDVSREELQVRNYGQDLPYLLDQTPSTVVSSDAGAGVGYTGIRIRGTDGTRINVTLNGIPVNEAESHGVFFVDLPDLASSVQSVQVQRGVGTSTNGPGAFGASLNIQTLGLRPQAYAEINQTYGSFNTLKSTVMAGTGLLNGKFAVDARLSRVSSDGYIDRASSNLKSYYLSGAYYGKKTMFKAVVMQGHERTYQAWNGVPEDSLKTNRSFNISGTDFYQRASPYDNEVDDYGQDYYQLHTSHQFNERWNVNLSLFNTRGGGYYEQYKVEDDMATYGISPVIHVNGNDSSGQPVIDTISTTDLIRKRWLKTNLYGATYALQYTATRLSVTLGGAAIGYRGQHFGEVIWAWFAGNTEIRDRYYDEKTRKTDYNTYLRLNYQLTDKLNVFADVQGRWVDYSFFGKNTDSTYAQQSVKYQFFNPKAGLTYSLSERASLYASWAVAHREPTRTDFTDTPPSRRPKAERLNNVEAGFRRRSERFSYSANFYLMQYRDQLVFTGHLDDVGNPIHQNVPDSYRTGVELQGGVQLLKSLRWQVNAAISRNKIKAYTEYLADYDNGGEIGTEFKQTDIAFSPNVIVGSQLQYSPVKGLELAWLSKYVGQQYLDNTGTEARSIDAYFVNDARLRYTVPVPKLGMKELELGLLVNNVFGREYVNNGYTYSYLYGGQITTENWYYPQATRNFLGQVALRF